MLGSLSFKREHLQVPHRWGRVPEDGDWCWGSRQGEPTGITFTRAIYKLSFIFIMIHRMYFTTLIKSSIYVMLILTHIKGEDCVFYLVIFFHIEVRDASVLWLACSGLMFSLHYSDTTMLNHSQHCYKKSLTKWQWPVTRATTPPPS